MKYETLDVSGLVDEFVQDFLEIIRTNVESLLRSQMNSARKRLLAKGRAAKSAEASPRRRGRPPGKAGKKAEAQRRGKKSASPRRKPEQLSLFG
ncbi:MAG TPA: hypothetical protein VFQ61_36215 [Polyangiaceae bacterium]|nr:hypothetical protein [Polyangiaceae bacterium]